jgi:histone acetyltransferase (RNA polymerase elongator complex component)
LLKQPSYQPKLSKLYHSGKWSPQSESVTVSLLKALSEVMPHNVRISRIQRQFDGHSSYSGSRPGLRSRAGIAFPDIRSREIGQNLPATSIDSMDIANPLITKTDQDITVELLYQGNVLVALARVRFRSPCTLVLRELRVYGDATPVGFQGYVQGRGFGKMLLGIIENLCTAYEAETLFVNASFGARPFFRMHGFTSTSDGFLKKKINFCNNKQIGG